MLSGTVENEMRRRDRLITEHEAESILSAGEYGILSTVSPGLQPYGIPLNYCIVKGNIYFHCALEGMKLEHIDKNPKVSFCVVGETRVLPDKFSTQYESSVVTGTAKEVFDAEKLEALKSMLEKYSQGFEAQGLDYINKVESRTRVFKILPDSITGKARR